MALPKVVADWDHEKGEPLRISGAEYVLWSPSEVDAFNGWLLDKLSDTGFTVDRIGDTFLIARLRAGDELAKKSRELKNDMGAGHVFGGAPADRDPTTAPRGGASPFRPSTRDWTETDTKYKEELAVRAEALLETYDAILGRRAEVPGAPRDIALAKTHLEDSVMRAVRALTA